MKFLAAALTLIVWFCNAAVAQSPYLQQYTMLSGYKSDAPVEHHHPH
jgi:hypothetical protein